MRTHGEVKRVDGKRRPSPEYRSWQSMRNRCLNPKATDYKYYGGRGIRIVPAWDSFEVFLADMGRRPYPDSTLDRERGDEDYGPNNCRWASRRDQARNRAYAKTQAWALAAALGVAPMTAHHMIWQVNSKRRGNLKWFQLSPEREQIVVDHMKKVGIWTL